jgi:hypothetical protein
MTTTAAVGRSAAGSGRVMSSIRSLFPVAPESCLRWRSTVVAFMAIGCGTWAEVARLGGNTAVNTIWAEDGNIFLAGAVDGGRWHAFIVTYNGYFNTVARLMGALAASLPLSWAAATFAIGSAGTVALLGGFVYRASAGHIPTRQIRFMLALIMVIMPATAFEVQDNAANLHWFFDYAAIWALLWRPTNWWDRSLSVVVIFLAATSDPLVAIFLPIALLRLLAVPKPEIGPVFALVGGLVIQGIAFVDPLRIVLSPPAQGIPSPLDLARIFGAHVLVPFFFGGTLGNALFGTFDYKLVALLALAPLIGIAYLIARRAYRFEGWLVLGFCAVAMAFMIIPVYQRWGSQFNIVPYHLIGVPARYWTVPLLCLWSGVAVVVGSLRSHALSHRAITVAVIGAFSIWFGAVALSDYGIHNAYRDAGPFWNQQMAAATTFCESAPTGSAATFLPPPRLVFGFSIPCARVVSGQSR